MLNCSIVNLQQTLHSKGKDANQAKQPKVERSGNICFSLCQHPRADLRAVVDTKKVHERPI